MTFIQTSFLIKIYLAHNYRRQSGCQSVLSQTRCTSDNKTQGVLLPQHYGALLPTLRASQQSSAVFCGIKGRGAWNRAQPIITAVLSYHKEAFKLVLVLPGRAGLPAYSRTRQRNLFNLLFRGQSIPQASTAKLLAPSEGDLGQEVKVHTTPCLALGLQTKHYCFPQFNHRKTQTESCMHLFFFLLSLTRIHRF